MELRLHTLIFVCMALGIVLGVLLWRVPEDAQQDGWYGAVLCLMANVIADNGPRVFESLGWYCGTVIGGIGVHVILLVAIVGTVGGMHP